jgi:hypothetical protein
MLRFESLKDDDDEMAKRLTGAHLVVYATWVLKSSMTTQPPPAAEPWCVPPLITAVDDDDEAS